MVASASPWSPGICSHAQADRLARLVRGTSVHEVQRGLPVRARGGASRGNGVHYRASSEGRAIGLNLPSLRLILAIVDWMGRRIGRTNRSHGLLQAESGLA